MNYKYFIKAFKKYILLLIKYEKHILMCPQKYKIFKSCLHIYMGDEVHIQYVQ